VRRPTLPCIDEHPNQTTRRVVANRKRYIHCVVTAGELGANGQWVNSPKRFLFPVKPLGEVFRGVFLYRLKRLYADKNLVLLGKCASLASQSQFQAFIDKLYTKRFNVYSKKPLGGVRGVHQYLAKYTHRIAISNLRLIAFDDNKVTFHSRNGKTASLKPLGFMARFISHVLPSNFVRTAHTCGRAIVNPQKQQNNKA